MTPVPGKLDSMAETTPSQIRSIDDLRGPAGRLEALLNTGRDDAPYAAIGSRQLSTCVTDMRKDFGTRIMGVAVSIASLRFTNEILGELNASRARSRCETADRANRSNFQTITTDASASAHPDLSRGDPRRSCLLPTLTLRAHTTKFGAYFL